MRRAQLLLAALSFVALGAADAQTIAITGGRVFPVSGPPIDDGTVLVRDGRIVSVGANIAIPEGAERLDARGKWVTPGLFNPSTLLGLVEVGAVAETRQANAQGGERDRVHAAFRVWEGVNPASVLLAAARNEGITSVMIHPNGGLVAGQAAVLDLVPGSASDMLVRGPVAMVAQVQDAAAAGTGAKGELLLRLRELLDDTRAYQRSRQRFDRGESRELAASRSDLEAMIPVLEGRLLLLVAADAASEIEAALTLARDYGLRIAITGGSEGWHVADRLAAARVPVLAGALNNIPGSFATHRARQVNPRHQRPAGPHRGAARGDEARDRRPLNVPLRALSRNVPDCS